jgi:hypothetical protein
MSISISGSNLTTGFNNTVLAPPYGSLSFNGINQSVITSGTGSGASGTVLDITTGSPSYTIECWIYASEHARSTIPQFFLNQGNAQNVAFSVLSGENSQVTVGSNVIQAQFYTTDLGWVYMSSWPTTISLNTWYHVALCRDTSNGNRYYLYLNGVLVSATPSVTPTVNQAQPVEFGMPASYISADPAYAFNGLLSNIRIVKGVALYVPPDVTVPTPPLASTQSLNVSAYTQAITGTQTSLLLTTPNNASYLTDTSSYAQTVTGVNNPTSSSMGPSTYSGSILFNGTNQYLYTARATQFNYSTNDFTWEMWIYPTATNWTSTTFYLMDHGPSVNQGTLHCNSGKLVYYNYYNTAVYSPATSGVNYPSLHTIGGGSITANTWTHVAVCRQNLVTNMFINGKLVSSGPDPYNFAAQSGAPFTSPPISPATQLVTIGSRSDGQYLFKGNISNIRIVNGVSVYNVGNFTPPVQPLPAIQAPNNIGSPSKSISSNQTSLLVSTPYNNTFLTDGSFNGVTLTQQTVGQYPPPTYTLTSNSPNPFNSNGSIFTPGSIFFNGTSQYLTVPDNAALQLSTGTSFTIEAWIYPTDLSVADHGIVAKRSAGSAEWQFNIHPSYGYLTFWNGVTTYQSDITLSVNNWYHVAVTWDTTTLRFFVNGLIGTTYTGLTLTPGNNTLTIGAVYANTGLYTGNISNLRIVNGTAVYTQTFIPTSGPFTTSQTFNQSGIPSCPVQSSQTELLLTTPSNSSYLTDSSTNAFTVTNVGTATSTPFNPFSGNYTILSNPGSVQFNGSTQYLTVPNNTNNTSLDMASGDFTVELWFNPSTTSGAIFTKRNSNINYSPIQLIWGSSQFTVYISTTGSSWAVSSVTTGSYLTGNWYHVALVRSSNLIYLYVNGVSSITPVAVSGSLMTNSDSFVVGADAASGPGSVFNGYISNFRIVKGVAVYTSAFVPPAGPLNNSQVSNQSGAPSAAVTSSQTSLLLNTAFGTNFLVDGSINNLIVTNVGTATSATLDPFVF